MIRGVLGGSFDPVHCGHLAMGRYILDQKLADRVHVVPARLSPHKSRTGASAGQRLTMVRLAFAGMSGVYVDDREIRRPGPSFTVDTLEDLASQYSRDQLLLIVGADSLAGLASWRNLDRIAALARVAVLARGEPAPSAFATGAAISPDLQISYHPDFDQPVSSTKIRAILGGQHWAPEDQTGLLPPAVAAYIAEHQLYRDGKE